MTTRNIPIGMIANAVRVALNQFNATEEYGLHATCLSCRSFDEAEGEICTLVGKKPPARVIAFACERYQDKDDIPF